MHKSADTVIPVLTSRRLYRAAVAGGKELGRGDERRVETETETLFVAFRSVFGKRKNSHTCSVTQC